MAGSEQQDSHGNLTMILYFKFHHSSKKKRQKKKQQEIQCEGSFRNKLLKANDSIFHGVCEGILQKNK